MTKKKKKFPAHVMALGLPPLVFGCYTRLTHSISQVVDPMVQLQ